MRSEGSAFLDSSGKVVAADDAFRSWLGLGAGDATAALRERAQADPALAALLAGEGGDVARISAGDGAGRLDLVRSACADGVFLRAWPADGLPAPALEYAMQSIALARVAGGVAHDVKNPLNAMALQIALLTDKIGAGGEPLAGACAANLASLKNQIGRVNDVVRRLADVADPATGTGFDAGGLAADVVSLFGHESRRRRVALVCEATAGGVQARGDAGRAARVLLGLVWRGLSRPVEGSRLLVRVAHDGDEALILVEHAGEPDPALAWMADVAGATARDMGGRLVRRRDGDLERLELRLRREVAA
jgi:signal transduction histidine kinase